MKNKRIFVLLVFYVVFTIFCFFKVDGEIEKMENVEVASVIGAIDTEKETPIEPIPVFDEEKPKKTYIGRFELTAYCPCEECSGGYGRMTATGKVAEQGRTVAVDPNIIPYGTKILIGDKTYIAEDCGGAVKGKTIDIFLDSHEEAKKFGRQKSNVFVLEG